MKKQQDSIKILTEIETDSLLSVGTKGSDDEFLANLDELIQARDDLFDARLKNGLQAHKRLLDITRRF